MLVRNRATKGVAGASRGGWRSAELKLEQATRAGTGRRLILTMTASLSPDFLLLDDEFFSGFTHLLDESCHEYIATHTHGDRMSLRRDP